MNIEAVGGGAGFTEVAHLGEHRASHRLVDIGILKHDERGVSTQFHGRFENLIGSRMKQFAANFGGAGK